MTALDSLLAALARRAPRTVHDPGRPEAAVALLLAPDPDRLLLIRRAERHGDPWSGHLALPGGRRDAADIDLLATAIRETLEEISVPVERDWCRATLDDLAPVNPVLPPILVRPFVFRLDHPPEARPNPEVTLARWVELAELAAPGVHRPAEVVVSGRARLVEGFHLPEGLLWGMTERILTPVIALWREGLAPIAPSSSMP